MSEPEPTPDLSLLPGIQVEDGEPVFNQPWEAQAFALVIGLCENGLFTWPQWAQALSEQIHGGEQCSYYQHWLNALEKLVADKNLLSREAVNARQRAWQEAAARTPHGEPIEL